MRQPLYALYQLLCSLVLVELERSDRFYFSLLCQPLDALYQLLCSLHSSKVSNKVSCKVSSKVSSKRRPSVSASVRALPAPLQTVDTGGSVSYIQRFS
jgi:hypothetical protein